MEKMDFDCTTGAFSATGNVLFDLSSAAAPWDRKLIHVRAFQSFQSRRWVLLRITGHHDASAASECAQSQYSSRALRATGPT